MVLGPGDARRQMGEDEVVPAVMRDHAIRGGEVDAVFNRGTWSVQPTGGGATTLDPGTGTTTVVLGTVAGGVPPSFAGEGQGLAVTFPVPSGTTLDPTSLGTAATLSVGVSSTTTKFANRRGKAIAEGSIKVGDRIEVVWVEPNGTAPSTALTATKVIDLSRGARR